MRPFVTDASVTWVSPRSAPSAQATQAVMTGAMRMAAQEASCSVLIGTSTAGANVRRRFNLIYIRGRYAVGEGRRNLVCVINDGVNVTIASDPVSSGSQLKSRRTSGSGKSMPYDDATPTTSNSRNYGSA